MLLVYLVQANEAVVFLVGNTATLVGSALCWMLPAMDFGKFLAGI
jgi:hypothetical protein